MKKIMGLLFVLPFLAVADEVDGIAATVGTEPILKSEVVEEMIRVNAVQEDYNDIRNALIDRKLILKAAEEAKMTMQDWVVESRIREIIERAFEGDRNKLMEMLSKQKISYPEWHKRMKDDMIVSAMRWSVVDKYVVARPSAMRKYYREHEEEFKTPSKVTVSVILLTPDDKMLREEVGEALQTKDFGEVAKAFSADTHAAEGGVWADVEAKDVFKPEVCEEIAKMPVHTLSHWIEIDGWSFLLRKDAEMIGEPLTFEEVYDQIEAAVRQRESKKQYDAWINRLRSETYIKVY